MTRRGKTLEQCLVATGAARPRGRRFAASLAVALIVCAGAAITAGAGNVVAQADEAQPAAAPADVSPAATTTADAPPVDPAPTAVAAPPVDPAPSDQAPADQAPSDQASSDQASSDQTPSDQAPPADDVQIATAPAGSDAVDTPQPAATTPPPAKARAAHPRAAAPKPGPRPAARTTQALPVPAAPPVFTPAAPFDLGAWEHANPAVGVGATAVAIARHFLGTPYVWGGASPSGGFDCSGLMQYVYAQLGISLPHYAAAQFALFPRLAPSQLRPGDLVFFEPKIDGPGHVAMYVGGDQILEAPHTGALVRVGSLSRSAAALGFMGAVRPYAPAAAAVRMTAMHHDATVTGPGSWGPGTTGLLFAV